MLKIILSGCCGHMGRVVTDMIKAESDMEIAAGIDITEDPALSYPVYSDLGDCCEDADVVIDFSTAAAIDSLLNACEAKKLPLVLCTTGLSEAQLARLQQITDTIPVLRSANMSLGINLIIELAKKAAAVFGEDFDVEIVEQHHNQKLDAPSGTALMIADAVKEVREESEYVYDRHAYRKKREKKEIGIHSVRGGNIVGEHEIIFAGTDEILKISHSARSKTVFAVGALNAAVFLKGKEPGMYDMSDLLASK